MGTHWRSSLTSYMALYVKFGSAVDGSVPQHSRGTQYVVKDIICHKDWMSTSVVKGNICRKGQDMSWKNLKYRLLLPLKRYYGFYFAILLSKSCRPDLPISVKVNDSKIPFWSSLGVPRHLICRFTTDFAPCDKNLLL